MSVSVSQFQEYKVEPKFWLIKFDEVLANEIKDKLRRAFKMVLSNLTLSRLFLKNILKTLLSQNENVQKYLKQVLQDVSKLMELIDQCADYIPPACGNYHQKVFNIIREETGLYLKEFLTSKKDVIERKCFEKIS